MRRVLLTMMLAAAPAVAEEARPTLAVLDPVVADLPAGAVEALGEAIRDTMVAAGKYRVQDRAAMREILAQQKLNSSEACDESCAVETGRLLQVRYLISATARKLEDTIRVSVRMTDVGTGEVVGVQLDSCKCSLNEAVSLVETLTRKIISGEKVAAPQKVAERIAPVPAAAPPGPAAPRTERHATSVRFETKDIEREFTVSLATEGGKRQCDNPVKYLQPCNMDVVAGSILVTVGGDAELTSGLTIPQAGRSIDIETGYKVAWTGVGMFLGGVALFGIGAAGVLNDWGGMRGGADDFWGIGIALPGFFIFAAGIPVAITGLVIGGPELNEGPLVR